LFDLLVLPHRFPGFLPIRNSDFYIFTQWQPK
jgi:hypothetical protein